MRKAAGLYEERAKQHRTSLAEEFADVLSYCVDLANCFRVDLEFVLLKRMSTETSFRRVSETIGKLQTLMRATLLLGRSWRGVRMRLYRPRVNCSPFAGRGTFPVVESSKEGIGIFVA